MNEIRTLELRFYPETAARFTTFANMKGRSVAWSNDGRWLKATLIFKNKTERSRFRSAWASASLVTA